MICWLDLETTGLDPKTCDILEFAMAFAYDSEPTKLFGEFSQTFRWTENTAEPKRRRVAALHPFTRAIHTRNGLLAECATTLVDAYEIEEEIIARLRHHQDGDPTKPNLFTLAGNSVHFDLAFLREHMPGVAAFFSHRLLDVSAINIFCKQLGMRPREKVEAHRALTDIKNDGVPLYAYCRDWVCGRFAADPNVVLKSAG